MRLHSPRYTPFSDYTKLIAALGLLLLAVVAPNAQDDIVNRRPRPGASARIYTTGGDTLNIRSGPSTDNPIVARAQPNTEVDVIGGPSQANGFSWWQVRLPDGTEGWTIEGFEEGSVFVPVLQASCPFSTGRIAYTAGSALYTTNPKGTDTCRLVDLFDGDISGLAWSADGSQLAYVETDESPPNAPPIQRLIRINADGTGHTVIAGDASSYRFIHWLNNDTELAYDRLATNATYGQIWVNNLDGTNPRALTSADTGKNGLSLSPDGTTLAYTEVIPVGEQGNTEKLGRIQLIAPDGSNPRTIDIGALIDVDTFSDLAWVDDETLMFAYDRDPRSAVDQRAYALLELTTETVSIVTTDIDARNVTLSPDSTRIAYTVEVGTDFTDYALRVVDRETGAVTFAETYNAYRFRPVWSPASDVILVPLASDGLLRIDLATSTATQLAGPRSVGEAAWQP